MFAHPLAHAARMTALVCVFIAMCAAPAFADAQFAKWIRDFRASATASGISGATLDRAFRGVTAPDPVVLEMARRQPEFSNDAWTYFDPRVNERTVADGRRMLREWGRWLDRIESHFGVDRHILLAIWSMESSYGEALKNPDRVRNIVRSLATLGYADRRRAKFAREQLVAALKILQSGKIGVENLTGSWAGAMGHTQFIPTSYIAYAFDADGDGRADIWNSVPDALATAANLLAKNGWRTGQTWGYEVNLPAGRKFPGGSMALSKWEGIGVTRANGRPYPRGGDNAELKVLGGREGPAFLMTRNFFVLKRYNNADRYALAVGLLADQIAGHNPPMRDWSRPFTRLSGPETEELQKRLGALGYYDGPVDGKIGPGSRDAIRAFQTRTGLTQDGHPSKEVLNSLRRRN